MVSQITSLTIVYLSTYSGLNQRKHQRSVSLAFVRGNHRWPVNSPQKGPVRRKMFPFDDVIMLYIQKQNLCFAVIIRKGQFMLTLYPSIRYCLAAWLRYTICSMLIFLKITSSNRYILHTWQPLWINMQTLHHCWVGPAVISYCTEQQSGETGLTYQGCMPQMVYELFIKTFYNLGWYLYGIRVNSRFMPHQWETALLCNDVSRWLGTNL